MKYILLTLLIINSAFQVYAGNTGRISKQNSPETPNVVSLDLDKVAFSTYGSYMAVSQTVYENKPGLYLRDVSGNRLWQWNGIFRIEAINNGVAVPFKTEVTPGKLRLMAGDEKTIEIAFQGTDVLRIRGNGLQLRLTQTIKDANSYYIPLDKQTIRAQMGGYAHYLIKSLAGEMQTDGIQTLERGERDKLHLVLLFGNNNHPFQVAIHQYVTGLRTTNFNVPFDSCVAQNMAGFNKFLEAMPPASTSFRQARYDASYVNWSAVISPKGFLKSDAMLMSKVNMRAVWSWDHCFNALASVKLPRFAINQFMLPFDYLDTMGAVPDIMLDHHITRGFVKPPVHGWALNKLMDKGLSLTPAQLKQCYNGLERWTNYWLTHMDDDHNGIPQYNHGNDSGWDNSTFFDMGYSVESPDLCAFLALQMECLSNLAAKLGKKQEAELWKTKSARLIATMIAYFWNGDKFTSKRTIDKSYQEESQSLMKYMPLVLGRRLPENIRQTMLAQLKAKGSNITAFGLATENPSSTLYEPDGYWRGPIWAPTTYLIIDGLRHMGENELARDLALKFCNMCAKSGFAENFDALSGAPLRDSGYTWTSSVFLLLTGEFNL